MKSFNLNMLKRLKSRAGNVAMIFALSVIPIVGVAGLAMDIRFTTTQRTKAQVALDNAMLVGARMRAEGATEQETRQAVRRFFKKTLKANDFAATCENVNVNFPQDSDDVEGSVTCTQETMITGVIGGDDVTFKIDTVTAYGIGKLEVAFVFDVSGSMDGTRLTDLKAAARESVNSILPPPEENEDSDVRIAMMSYASAVDAKQFFTGATGLDTLHDTTVYDYRWVCTSMNSSGDCTNGYWADSGYATIYTSQVTDTCTIERSGDNRYTDAAPGAGDYLAAFPYTQVDSSQNIIRNGSFEFPNIGNTRDFRNDARGWRGTYEIEFMGHGYGGVSASMGDNHIEVDAYSGYTYNEIWQDVDTDDGQAYHLTFDYRPKPGRHWSSGVEVWWGGEKIADLDPSSSHDWRIFHAEVMGSGSDRLIFKPKDNDYDGMFIDNVVVTERYPMCNSAGIVPLTKNKTTLNDYIDSMVASGATAGHMGVFWAWYLISPNWNSVWGSDSEANPYTDPELQKVIILMTDGQFNRSYSGSDSTTQAKALCDNAKAEGTIIFSVAFQAPSSAEDTLKYCASSATHFFDPSTGQQLQDAYDTIATTISDLRIKL